ncbi:hypothetical protein SDC9_121422 [bioreactor metagenome]|uniref:Uncharacterized protein n=1 Tax=bioreactor metagenome TaxID=1076179 RepID=A0A645CBY1_9ZZZZ
MKYYQHDSHKNKCALDCIQKISFSRSKDEMTAVSCIDGIPYLYDYIKPDLLCIDREK